MATQINLFDYEPPTPDWLLQLLAQPKTILSCSTSGGKDSQALLSYLLRQKYPCQLQAVHADLGLMEWPGTQAWLEQMCAKAGVELITVRAKKSLFRYILERLKKRSSQVFWMSPSNRYCTSYMKIAPINKYLRRYQTVVNTTEMGNFL